MTSQEIDESKMYTTGETADITGLSLRQVSRLVDQGQFPGSRRKSPAKGSPREIPGSGILKFLEARQTS